MSGHRLLQDLYLDGTPYAITDPGDAAAFVLDRQFAVIEIVSAGAETRTLNDPKFTGQRLLLTFKTDGGDVTITAATQIDASGSTSIVLGDEGDMVDLVGVTNGSSLEWRVVASDVIAGIGYLPLTGGTLTGTLIGTAITMSGLIGGATGTFSSTLGVTGIITSSGGITMADAKDIITNATTGTKIATAASQKLSFWGVAPVIQQAAAGGATGFTAGSGTAAKDDSTHTGNSGSKAYTVTDIVLALKNTGILEA